MLLLLNEGNSKKLVTRITDCLTHHSNFTQKESAFALPNSVLSILTGRSSPGFQTGLFLTRRLQLLSLSIYTSFFFSSSPSNETSRKLTVGEMYLVDSGGQYLCVSVHSSALRLQRRVSLLGKGHMLGVTKRESSVGFEFDSVQWHH